MPTIKDVARQAGVSPATVSYVLNRTRYVSPAIEARVRAAIAALDYQPDYIARSLRARRTLTAGLIVSDIANPFYADIVRGAEDVLSPRHYSLIVCNTDEAPERELSTLHALRHKKVDGLIVVATGANVDPLYEMSAAGLPIVLVDRQLPGDRLDTVVTDNRTGGYHAVRHLLELGHRRIGLIAGRAGISTTWLRRAGYEAALSDYALAPQPALIRDGQSTIDGGAAAASALLDLDPPPTALFAANNLMTVGAFLAIKRRGLRCPKEIAVVGFDDIVWLSVFSPAVTAVAQPAYELGGRAAELLWERMAGTAPVEPRLVVLPPRLIVRESCGYNLSRKEVSARSSDS